MIPEPFLQKCAILAGTVCLAIFLLAIIVSAVSLESLATFPQDHIMDRNLVVLALLALGCTVGSFLLCWSVRKR